MDGLKILFYDFKNKFSRNLARDYILGLLLYKDKANKTYIKTSPKCYDIQFE